MKSVVKVMLVWVISFSLALPVGSVWAAERVSLEQAREDARARRETKRFEEEQKQARERTETEINSIKENLDSHLDEVKNGMVFNGLIGKYFEALDDDDVVSERRIYPLLKNKIVKIVHLSSRLKSLSESYEKKYSDADEDYKWSEIQKDLELDENGQPIVKVTYKGKEQLLALSDFEEEETMVEPEEKEKSDKSEKKEEAKAHRHRASLFDDEDKDEKISRATRDDERERARTEFSGCPSDRYDNEPTPTMKALGALGLGILGAGTIALGGINMSYAHKQRKNIGHMMERASARGDSPYLYMPAFASAINYNPFAGIGETLGPISMAISSLLMGGDRGYLTQQEFMRNQRLNMLRDMFSAQARANTSVTGSSTRRVEIQRSLQGLDGFAKDLSSRVNGLVDGIGDAFKNVSERATGGLSGADINQILKLNSNISQNLQILAGFQQTLDQFGDIIKKQAANLTEAAGNAQNAINSNGGFNQVIEQTSSGSFRSNRSGTTTGPNGFSGAPGFPQIGGGFSGGGRNGFNVQAGFGPRGF